MGNYFNELRLNIIRANNLLQSSLHINDIFRERITNAIWSVCGDAQASLRLYCLQPLKFSRDEAYIQKKVVMTIKCHKHTADHPTVP